MTPSVLLSTDELTVAPGATVSTDLRVRNAGDIVDEFTFEPLGDAADWITVEPSVVRLFPDTDAVVTVTIAPPHAPSTPSGPTAWAVKTIPLEHPENASVAEGTVIVGSFTDLSAELQPAARHGRLRGRFDLAIDNRSNVPLAVRVAGNDAKQALAFHMTPASFDARPGTATFTRLKLKPIDRIWRGQPKSHMFQVLVSAQPSTPPTVDKPSLNGDETVVPVVQNGTFVQEPVLPKWLLKAVLITAALLLVLFILWKTLLKPTFESAARAVAIEEVDAVDEEVAELAEAVDVQAQQVQQAQETASAAAEEVAEVEESVEAVEAGGSDDTGGILSDTSDPTNFRLAVTAVPGESGSNASPANGENTTFALTDVMLQNPGGDAGRIRVLINGAPIMESALENFRDLDFHFVSPYVVGPGANVTVEVDCAVDQLVDGDPCKAAVSFAGFTTTSAEEG